MGQLNSRAFPPGTSRYTQAMAKCLDQTVPDVPPSNRAVAHTLVNLVQGRMLEYLADRICRSYEIEDEHSKTQIVTALLNIFSDEFFAVFRARIDREPTLAAAIARRIIRKEAGAPGGHASDRLYPAIFRKYFEYHNLGDLQQMVESDAVIQKILLLAMLRRSISDTQGYQKLARLLEQDSEGFVTAFFMDRVRHKKLAELIALVESGAWRGEVDSVRERMAHLRGD